MAKEKEYFEEEDNMMEFVPNEDAIPEIPQEQKDEEQKPDEPKKRKNIFKRAWSGIKWVGRKVRESPAATVIGGLAGSALTFGGIALYEGKKAKQYATLQIAEVEDDPELDELTGMEEAEVQNEDIVPEEDNVDEAV